MFRSRGVIVNNKKTVENTAGFGRKEAYRLELLKNQSYRDNIKIKAREVEEKDLILQAKEYEDGLVTTPAKTLAKGHAASTDFGKQEISEDPSSTANTFQPGSWLPKK
ncbi:hypothetical protein KUCAC02_028304 [Chaenocephalus aceratus]|uniref:Uncharacterized protein n=1 Tax=Chaenocephalus aceratus TaxID=36190 RepID=A0ACB9X1F7_CHAAC|nr:hypothetical protein KUCAC02_028304 [Chaenocephalus aceratus]